MGVPYPCCCGLDVNKKSIADCVLWAEPIRDVYVRTAGAGRLAARVRCDARRDGSDRGLLEAGLEHSGGPARQPCAS